VSQKYRHLIFDKKRKKFFIKRNKYGNENYQSQPGLQRRLHALTLSIPNYQLSINFFGQPSPAQAVDSKPRNQDLPGSGISYARLTRLHRNLMPDNAAKFNYDGSEPCQTGPE